MGGAEQPKPRIEPFSRLMPPCPCRVQFRAATACLAPWHAPPTHIDRLPRAVGRPCPLARGLAPTEPARFG